MIRLIVACDQKNGIAKHGIQPWSIPDDEAYFARQTKLYGGMVLMGRKTLNVMGKPLDNRDNYIVTSRAEPIVGATVVNDLEAFMQSWGDRDLWVIGGASIYQWFIDNHKTDELYVTHIAADFNCDQFFPDISSDAYILDKQSEPQSQNGFEFTYAVYIKK